jgi:hypothetical protein
MRLGALGAVSLKIASLRKRREMSKVSQKHSVKKSVQNSEPSVVYTREFLGSRRAFANRSLLPAHQAA